VDESSLGGGGSGGVPENQRNMDNFRMADEYLEKLKEQVFNTQNTSR
jgi:hypothetical protein